MSISYKIVTAHALSPRDLSSGDLDVSTYKKVLRQGEAKAALLGNSRGWKQPLCSSVEDCLNKINNYGFIMEYSPVTEKE